MHRVAKVARSVRTSGRSQAKDVAMAGKAVIGDPRDLRMGNVQHRLLDCVKDGHACSLLLGRCGDTTTRPMSLSEGRKDTV